MTRKGYDRVVVIALAMDVFWRHGFRSTTVGLLCEATGLNPKSLYAEFGSKEALFEAALEMYAMGGLAQSREALTNQPLGLDNIRRYFTGMRYEADCRGCLMTMTINEREHVPSAAVDTVAETLRAIETLLRQNLEAGGVEEGALERITPFLVFSIQGITTMGKLHGDNARLAMVVSEILRALEPFDRAQQERGGAPQA